MKLNKIEAVTATTSEDVDGSLVEPKPTIQLRYLTDEGGYHRASFDADSVPDMPEAEKALVQVACDEVAKIPTDSDFSQLHFYPAAQQAVFASDPSGKVAADGVVAEPRFGMVGIRNRHKAIADTLVAPCFKCEKSGEILDTDLEALPVEAQGFAKAMYAHNNGFYKELTGLLMLEDEPDYQATETAEIVELVESTEIVEGKAVIKKTPTPKTVEVPLFDEFPCVDEDGDGICDECGTTHEKFPITKPKVYKVPRMVKGKKVSDTDKARLAELLGKI